jgi:hypothetical protein
MTTNIITVYAVPGQIMFTAITDAGGCDEDFETSIGDVRYSAHLSLSGAGVHPGQSIAHNLSGPYVITVTARASNVSSYPTPLVLIGAAAPAGMASY